MRRIFRKDLRNDPPRQLSRSRLALGILEVIAKRRFRYDLARGIMPADIGRDDIIFAEMLAPRNLLGWLGWLKSFPK
ncbi:MAG TPA: hypothetical protein VMB70_03270, partial [Terriglobia bacterium]|nr:hypothetical protein [Terriglobia bacterium]